MCTSITLKSDDSLVLHSRTMDFPFDLNPDMVFIPRNYEMTFTYKRPLRNHNAFMGLARNNIFPDGINEHGLCAAVLYFPGYAQYGREQKEKSLAPFEVVSWILSVCSDIDSVRAELEKMNLVDTVVDFLGISPPLHWVFVDATGASIIAEPLESGLKITENKLGVFTNSPDIDWHLTNVRNYIGLSQEPAATRTIFGTEFISPGQGSGTFGLPGDYTPPSRFIRALFNKLSLTKIEGEKELVLAASHVLNNVDIPKGSVATPDEFYDYTQYTTYMVSQSQSYYFRLYDSSRIIKVKMSEFSLDSSESVTLKTETATAFTDIKR